MGCAGTLLEIYRGFVYLYTYQDFCFLHYLHSSLSLLVIKGMVNLDVRELSRELMNRPHEKSSIPLTIPAFMMIL